jgi:hypothetical protein
MVFDANRDECDALVVPYVEYGMTLGRNPFFMHMNHHDAHLLPCPSD